MSAIYGIIEKKGRPSSAEQVSALRAAIVHREANGAFGHVATSVVFGCLPMAGQPQRAPGQNPLVDGDFTLVADVRLDNRKELYGLLAISSERGQALSDPALLLESYRKWGAGCVDRLDGEYAFAIWDARSSSLFMATDAIGYRPIFYYNDAEQFIFCSEIKGIAAARRGENWFNEEHLLEYHFRQSDPAQTYNRDIFALCGGRTLTLSKGQQPLVNRYYSLHRTGKYHFKHDGEWIACYRELLFRAVEKRLDTSLPVGLTLSGGLDSSSLAAILAPALAKKNQPLYTFSSVLPAGHQGIERDESEFIRLMTQRYPNIIPTFIDAPGKGPLTDIAASFNREEALPNTFHYMDTALAAAAAQKGVRSLFSGFGGDYWASWKGYPVVWSLLCDGKIREAVRTFNSLSAEDPTIVQRLRSYVFAHIRPYQFLGKLRHWKRTDWQTLTLLDPAFVSRHAGETKMYGHDQFFLMKDFIESGRIGRLAARMNTWNASYGISSNEPMFDKDLMEFLADVPLRLFLGGGRRRGLIRSAMSDLLPEPIRDRKDKRPYAPDYIRRMIECRETFHTTFQPGPVFSSYFSIDRIAPAFDQVKPRSEFGRTWEIVAIRTSQALISAAVIDYLQKKNYHFQI